jgi:hypothetical protein
MNRGLPSKAPYFVAQQSTTVAPFNHCRRNAEPQANSWPGAVDERGRSSNQASVPISADETAESIPDPAWEGEEAHPAFGGFGGVVRGRWKRMQRSGQASKRGSRGGKSRSVFRTALWPPRWCIGRGPVGRPANRGRAMRTMRFGQGRCRRDHGVDRGEAARSHPEGSGETMGGGDEGRTRVRALDRS